jgi:sec-independent protein translocase protein TatB
MFDISWTEFLLIGVVALVVIGPKELPAVMRTMGQWMRKVRSMAGEFQNQFHEAMREAEMTDLKKQVDDMAHDVSNLDPLKDVRDDFHAIGRDVETSLSASSEPHAVTASGEPLITELPASEPAPAADSVPVAHAEPAAPLSLDPAHHQPPPEMAALNPEPDEVKPPVEKIPQPEGSGRSE